MSSYIALPKCIVCVKMLLFYKSIKKPLGCKFTPTHTISAPANVHAFFLKNFNENLTFFWSFYDVHIKCNERKLNQ